MKIAVRLKIPSVLYINMIASLLSFIKFCPFSQNLIPMRGEAKNNHQNIACMSLIVSAKLGSKVINIRFLTATLSLIESSF